MNLPWNKNKRIAQWLADGAVVVDVRTKGEYQSGAVAHSLNIPVNEVATKIAKAVPKDKKIIACCASGMRSAAASAQLKAMGYEAMNGGTWVRVAQVASEA